MSEFNKWAIIAEQNGIRRELFAQRVKDYKWDIEDAAVMPKGSKNPKKERDVAIYKGDQFIIWGKLSVVARKLGKTRKSTQLICSPSQRKKLEKYEDALYGIYIEDDEEVIS